MTAKKHLEMADNTLLASLPSLPFTLFHSSFVEGIGPNIIIMRNLAAVMAHAVNTEAARSGVGRTWHTLILNDYSILSTDWQTFVPDQVTDTIAMFWLDPPTQVWVLLLLDLTPNPPTLTYHDSTDPPRVANRRNNPAGQQMSQEFQDRSNRARMFGLRIRHLHPGRNLKFGMSEVLVAGSKPANSGLICLLKVLRGMQMGLRGSPTAGLDLLAATQADRNFLGEVCDLWDGDKAALIADLVKIYDREVERESGWFRSLSVEQQGQIHRDIAALSRVVDLVGDFPEAPIAHSPFARQPARDD